MDDGGNHRYHFSIGNIISWKEIVMYIRYFLFVLIDLIAMLLGLVLVAVGLMFCSKDDVRLPGWLDWCYGNRQEGINYFGKVENNGFWQRYKWCALRNPTHNLAIDVLGYPLMLDQTLPFNVYVMWDEAVVMERTKKGDVEVSEIGHPGWYLLKATIYGKRVFEFYWIYRYPFWPSHCLRVRLGWKLTSMRKRAQLVHVPNPARRYTPSGL
jgi:hypothetical protein